MNIRNSWHIELAQRRAIRQHARASVLFTTSTPRAKPVQSLAADADCPSQLNTRLSVTSLEDRTVPATFTVTALDPIAENGGNQANATVFITVAPNCIGIVPADVESIT